MFEELDLLTKALPAKRHLQWRFSADREHDMAVLDWFSDGGEIEKVNKFLEMQG